MCLQYVQPNACHESACRACGLTMVDWCFPQPGTWPWPSYFGFAAESSVKGNRFLSVSFESFSFLFTTSSMMLDAHCGSCVFDFGPAVLLPWDVDRNVENIEHVETFESRISRCSRAPGSVSQSRMITELYGTVKISYCKWLLQFGVESVMRVGTEIDCEKQCGNTHPWNLI